MSQDKEFKVKEIKEYHFGNMTIKVIKPDLTEEEYQRRHKELERATINLLKSKERSKQEAL
ncbi:MAG: hypothetical protein J6C19_02365 [Lachnospiraceae bacterium]|nr:hypothetical protein [Lachnospiraceae bacterium]MBO5144363.1 hypothetical protein [Lachnospiraceae bacterium]